MQRRIRTWGIWYLFGQSILASLWWGSMLLAPEWRAWFFVLPSSEMHWMAFLLPDLIFYVGAGWMAAVGLRHEHRWAWPVLVLHTGAVGYAALYGLASSLISSAAWPGTILMLGSFFVSAWFARRLCPF